MSNPPYISTKEISSLQREVENRESRYALDSGHDGLSVIKVILRNLSFLLDARGPLWLEADDSDPPKLKQMLQGHAFVSFTKQHNDQYSRSRSWQI